MSNRPQMRPDRRGRRPTRGMAALAVAVAVLSIAGCSTIRSLFPESRKEEATATRLLQLQASNMRYADVYVGTLIEATRRLEMAEVDPEQRYALSGWLLAEANAAYSNASADNAFIGCLDLVTLAALSRMVIEKIGSERFLDQAAAVLAVHRELEAAAWELAAGILVRFPGSQADVRHGYAFDDFDGTEPYTLETWFRADQYDGVYRHLFNKDFTGTNGRHNIGLFVCTGELLGFERIIASSKHQAQAPLPSVGAWTHIVGTYDGAALGPVGAGAHQDQRGSARPPAR